MLLVFEENVELVEEIECLHKGQIMRGSCPHDSPYFKGEKTRNHPKQNEGETGNLVAHLSKAQSL